MMPDWVAPAVMLSNLALFNLAILKLFQIALRKVDLRGAMMEKNEPRMVAAIQAGATGEPEQTSFSRVAGGVGAIVVSCFLWALGNIVLFKSFTAMTEVGQLLESVKNYFFVGASLFAPYAFNQLRSAFQSNN